MKRSSEIDVMRSIALMLIFIAHLSSVSEKILNLRSFDVVTMVFLAGFSYRLSNNKKNEKYMIYLWKRLKKLLFTTWIFLSVLFSSVIMLKHSFQPWGWIRIIQSFLLYDGIGYVWFIRVILMLAIISPIFYKLLVWMKNSAQRLWIIIICWIGSYTIVLLFYNITLGKINFLFSLIIYLFPIYLLGYSIVYYLGMVYIDLSVKTKFTILCFSGVMYIFCLIETNLSVIDDKYPPGIIYLSYGIFISCILYEILHKFYINRKCSKYITWISKHSFDIYLLHIIPLLIIKYSDNNIIFIIKNHSILEMIFICLITGLSSILLEVIKNKIKVKRSKKNDSYRSSRI